MKTAFAYHVFFLLMIIYVSLKVSERDILKVYDSRIVKKKNKSDSSFRQLKRLFYKKTGAILSPLESIYVVFVIICLSLVFAVTPLFDENIYDFSTDSLNLAQNGTFVILLIMLLAFLKLIAPRSLIEISGKEYFVSTAFSQLLMAFIFMMMCYLYGSMKIKEMVVYQATEGVAGLPNWGLMINPFLFASAVSLLVLSEKSRGRTKQMKTQLAIEVMVGTGKEAFVELLNLLNTIMLTLLIVLFFMGGYHLPEIALLTNLKIPGLVTILQSLTLLAKLYFLLFFVGLIKNTTTLRSDYRLNRLKVLILFPSILIGLLVMPIFYFGRG